MASGVRGVGREGFLKGSRGKKTGAGDRWTDINGSQAFATTGSSAVGNARGCNESETKR
jgi:hypothetical protein